MNNTYTIGLTLKYYRNQHVFILFFLQMLNINSILMILNVFACLNVFVC